MRWLGVMALLLAAGCGEEGPVRSYADYRSRAARLACQRAVRCGVIGESDEEACRAVQLEKLAAYPSSEERDAASGRLAFDAAAAEACLEAMGIGCGDRPRVCERLYRGRTAAGEACQRADECAEGWCDGPGGCGATSTCRPFPTDGGAIPCRSGACPSGYSCDYRSQRCLPAGRVGDGCDRDQGCRPDLVCIRIQKASIGACREPGREGEPCDFAARDDGCRPDLRCVTTAAGRRCASRVGQGGACSAATDCREGLACIGLLTTDPDAESRCLPWLDVGRPCDTRLDPLATSGCPLSARCNYMTGLCQPFTAGIEGESCAPFGSCRHSLLDPPLYCARTALGSICARQAALGEPCQTTGGAPCETGACREGRCRTGCE